MPQQFLIGEGNGNPLQCSCLENPRDDGVWWAAVCGVAQSRTRLKRLGSSSSSSAQSLQLYQMWLRSIPHIHVFVYEQQGWRRWKYKAMGYKKTSRESNKLYSWGLGRGKGFPSGSGVKNLPAMQETQETWVWFLGQEDTLEEGLATHSSVLAWRIPWTEEPDGL